MPTRKRMTAVSLLAAVCVAGVLLADEKGAPPRITGNVVYRERVALPPDAIIRVRLEAAPAPEMAARRVAEITIPTEGMQVPIPFALPYDAAAIHPGTKYQVRVTISSGDKTLFVTRTPYPVLTQGAPAKLEILVQQAGGGRKPRPVASTTSLGLAGHAWKLVALADASAAAAPDAAPASLVFGPTEKRISGSTGCNRLLGTYAPGEGFALKLDPSSMTLMACPDSATRQEAAFLAALRATTAYRIEGASLELLDGDRVLARFEADGGVEARTE
jgi:putative lipoprotein